jgi:hypothetical protein
MLPVASALRTFLFDKNSKHSAKGIDRGVFHFISAFDQALWFELLTRAWSDVNKASVICLR